jgi:transposase
VPTCRAHGLGSSRRLRPDQAAGRFGHGCRDRDHWIGWVRRSRLDAFKRLGEKLSRHRETLVHGMFEHRSNAFVEAMNGFLQQAERAARRFRNAATFISIAYLRMGKLTDQLTSPFAPAIPRDLRHVVRRV